MRTKTRTVKGYVRSYVSDDRYSDKSATAMEVCVDEFAEDIHRACLDGIRVQATLTWHVPIILDVLEKKMVEWKRKNCRCGWAPDISGKPDTLLAGSNIIAELYGEKLITGCSDVITVTVLNHRLQIIRAKNPDEFRLCYTGVGL